MSEYHLPTLYKTDAKGKKRSLDIWVINDVLYSSAGLCDGKKVDNTRKISETANTTSTEQARLEAERKWVKSLKDYIPECKEGLVKYHAVLCAKNKSGGHNRTASETLTFGCKKANARKKITVRTEKNFKVSPQGVDVPSLIPMKAVPWNRGSLATCLKHINLGEGAYIQPKLDGQRCVARIISGQVVLTTATGKEFPWFEKIRKEILYLLDNGNVDYCDGLDGELFANKFVNADGSYQPLANRFNIIQGCCGVTNISPSIYEDQLEYHIFDLVDLSSKLTQTERSHKLKDIFAEKNCTKLVRVKTLLVDNIADVQRITQKYIDNGFEGAIVRNSELKYQTGRRSLQIRKIKYDQDDEFKVVGIKRDEGVSAEHFVWVCVTSSGKEFKAKPMGDKELKLKFYKDHKIYIGKLLTVIYQDLGIDGVPRFPHAKGFREDIINL